MAKKRIYRSKKHLNAHRHQRKVNRRSSRKKKYQHHSNLPLILLVIVVFSVIVGSYFLRNVTNVSEPIDTIIKNDTWIDNNINVVENVTIVNDTINAVVNISDTIIISQGFNYYNMTPRTEELEEYLSSNIYYKTQFLYQYPIMKSPMYYYVYTDTPITDNLTEAQTRHILYKKYYDIALEQIPKAFDEWEKATGGKVDFIQSDIPVKDGISVKIVSEIPRRLYGNVYDIGSILGVSNPSYSTLNNYTLISGGDVTLRADYSPIQTKNVMVHELGHMMGFAHTMSQNSIMFFFYDKFEYYGRITDYDKKVLEIMYRDVSVFKL